jgi:phage portal protein BeeE
LNAGIPSGLLKFKTKADKIERDKVRQQWKDRYTLRANVETGGAFDLFVTDADVEYQEIGSRLKTMDLSGVFSETESRICATFGVSPILIAAFVGLAHSTFANYGIARKQLYNDTLKPRWISTADRISVDLASEFGAGVICKFELDDIPELQEDKEAKKALSLAAWNASGITRNEFRQAMGLPPDAEGDVYKVSPNDTFEPAAILSGQHALPSWHEHQHLLPMPEEKHAIDDWRKLQVIAKNAEPALKKKSCQQLHAVEKGSM